MLVDDALDYYRHRYVLIEAVSTSVAWENGAGR